MPDDKTDYGMPSRPIAAVAKAAVFQVRRPDTRQFSTLEGTCRMAGVPAHRLRRLIAKEVADNALDACDHAGCPGRVTIERDGDSYTVTDHGGGIGGDAAVLADLFSTARPMLSGKYWRTILRGVLGNGLRVMCAAVMLSGGSITVETNERRTVLRPQRFGTTEVAEQTLSDVTTGTRITYTLDATIPHDPDDLADAIAAIGLARAAAPPYARRPSPHWLDADHLAEVFAAIEPSDTTLRQLIEQLDGCTGPTAGRLAALFGKGRTCRSMTDAETPRLLRAMQDAARVVKARSLGPIGADAFGDMFDAYIVNDAALQTGARAPYAICPVLIEAWAAVRTRKGGGASLRIFVNRTPVVGGASATRSLGNRIALSGAGLDGAAFDAAGGECDLILAVTAPLIPQTSLGKAADLSLLRPPIVDALRRAFVRSRNRLPADLKQPKPPKHTPPPKPSRPPPYAPSGPLAVHLAAEAEAEGVKPRDLLVLSPTRDPFNETNASRRDAQWFADQVARFKPDGQVHLRGMYYRILAAGDVLLPDRSRFVGTAETSQLIEKAGKYARYLGLVAFDRIVDERAAPPELYDTDGERADPDTTQARELTVADGATAAMASIPAFPVLLPTLAASEAEKPRQPFRICMVGEKTSLGDVLRPLAQEVGAELLLETGEISEAHAYGIAARAAADGRPLRVLYFGDFDPSGWQMSVSLARKLQAHIVREFPGLDVRVIRVALTFEQVQQFNLPDSPIKPGEDRAPAWRARWGREQVEIDALAALRPDLLDQIARDAVAPYFDATLTQRFAAATALPADLQDWLQAQPTYRAAQAAISAMRGRALRSIAIANKRVEQLNTVVADSAEAVRQAVAEAADKPDLPPVEIAPEVEAEPDAGAVFDTRDTFIDATRKLQKIKREYDDPDDDTDPDGDDRRRAVPRPVRRRRRRPA
jgi:DNA topoisomerase VI subunit B